MSFPTVPAVAPSTTWEGAEGHPAVPLDPRTHLGRARYRRVMPMINLLGDAVGLWASILVVAWVGIAASGTRPAFPGSVGFDLLAWTVIVAVLAARGTYSGARRHIAPRVADDLASLVAGLAIAGVCLLAIDAVGPFRDRLSPGAVGQVLVASLVLVPCCRSVGILLASQWPANVVRVVVVGSDEIARSLVARLSCSRMVAVVGVVDDEATDGPRTIEELPRFCREQRVDRVVIAFSRCHPSRSAQVLLALQGSSSPGGSVDIDVVARYYELVSWESRLSDVTGLSLISVGRPPGPVSRATKRLLDIWVATTSLAVLSPVLIATAIAVRLDSGGPVLFRQTRVGRGQKPFRIVKFRTMLQGPSPTEGGAGHHDVAGGPAGRPSVRSSAAAVGGATGPSSPLETVADPARITRLGRFLRRSGLDELPQLVNVLRGEMSLVGPRPFVPTECGALQGWGERRFDVRPGMTGMWQVCGQHELSLEELCRLDVQYATSWSLRSDLRILARTPGRLFHGSAPGR